MTVPNMVTVRPRLSPWLAALCLALHCIEAPAEATAAPSATTTPAEPAAIDYQRQVKPILTRHCVGCHGAVKPRGGLRLDTAAAALKGGKNGPALVIGQGDESPIIAAVRGDGPGERMPLNRPALIVSDIKLLKDWIDQGANADPTEQPGLPPSQAHWAFVAPKRPTVPDVANMRWARNAVDRFILARLEKAGVAPSAEAERATLLRRASLDLVGLPPSPEEIATFLADRSEFAYERVVDRLMASPHFGERWARPWLDQARYADSNGYNIDAPRSIWKYRDWVIAAFNADMPFDRFTIDQIAGDLRPKASLAERIATGFHRNTQINQEGGIDVEQFRIDAVIDRVNTTGTVFLGLTIGCAQCHDHKYDPIAQRDYYKLFAFFNNVDEPDLEIATPAELSRRKAIEIQIDDFHRGLAARYPDLDERERKWETTLALAFTQVQTADVRVAFDLPREKRSSSQRRALVELMIVNDPAHAEEKKAFEKLRAALPTFVTTMVVRERSAEPRATHVHLGGDFTRKGERVAPGVPGVLPSLDDFSPGTLPDRLNLAHWLVDRRNPLIARVTVNRIWQAYFGRGLVETDNDFGTQGAPPSHPELLDWLACELMDSGWSLKAIHRLIVSSATYRQASVVRPDGNAVDPDNRLLWRQTRLRIDAELIRDAALSASGLLTRVVGGPSVFPPQPDGVMNLGQMRRPWQADTGADRYRRGLYTFFWRATPNPFLTTFDAPGGVQSCTRRFRSNTPLQALTLLNDPASIEIAKGLAARISAEQACVSGDRERLRYAFLLCLGRPPSDRELATLEALLRSEREPDGAMAPAWLTVARVLLNLDEFVTRE
jgi:mono/diheme cytochrome c family protein